MPFSILVVFTLIDKCFMKDRFSACKGKESGLTVTTAIAGNVADENG